MASIRERFEAAWIRGHREIGDPDDACRNRGAIFQRDRVAGNALNARAKEIELTWLIGMRRWRRKVRGSVADPPRLALKKNVARVGGRIGEILVHHNSGKIVGIGNTHGTLQPGTILAQGGRAGGYAERLPGSTRDQRSGEWALRMADRDVKAGIWRRVNSRGRWEDNVGRRRILWRGARHKGRQSQRQKVAFLALRVGYPINGSVTNSHLH